jgi:8-oxo-dGTP diphosphatase
MRNDRKHVIGVAAVTRNAAGKILLIKTEKAGWELPGGKVEPGEDFITALVREVREEACCEVEVGRLTGVTSSVGTSPVTVFTFTCRHVSDEPHPGDDSIDVGWFTPDAALKAVTHTLEQYRLADALDDSDGVVYRAYRRITAREDRPERYDMLVTHRC